MKAVAQPIVEPSVTSRSLFSILSKLFKARLTFLVVITTAVGFYMGQIGSTDFGLLFATVLGTALVACGAAALNQYWERDLDALMERTEDRPLPARHITPQTALMIGVGLSSIGLLFLAFRVNFLTSLLGAITLATYVFVYTPLKRITTLNTIVGAIPGALPPLMGWTAAQNAITIEGWALFAILFFWQLPHFMAIAWLYREDYAKAGFAMLPVVDKKGIRTGMQAVWHTLGLVGVSLFPAVFGMSGRLYFASAILLGALFLFCSFRFARDLTIPTARGLFFISIIYLPALLGIMVLDKVRLAF